MRIIHTSDWHLGNAMFDIDRTEEIKSFFVWLRQQIVEREADALVIAGDIFDNRIPSNEMKTLYYRFLASLLDTGCRNIFVAGGNHDSGALLDATGELAEALNIHVAGTIADRSVEDLIYEITDKSGECSAICALIPFIREADLRRFYDGKWEERTFSDHAYGELYRQVLEAVDKKKAGRKLPVIVTGHLYAAALEGRYGDVEDDEKEMEADDGVLSIDVRGNLGKVHADVFPGDFTYVALGHIHYTSMVAGENRIRYSGSPFVMGFDETDIPRYVLQVDLEESTDGFSPVVEKLRVPGKDRFVRVCGSVDEIRERLLALKAEVQAADGNSVYAGNEVQAADGNSVYVEIVYRQEDRALLENVIDQAELPERLQIVHWKKMKTARAANSFEDLRMEDVREIRLEDVVRCLVQEYYPPEVGISEEEAETKVNALVEEFLPYFREAENKVRVQGGDGDEDN